MDLSSAASDQNFDEYKSELLSEIERSRNQLDDITNMIEQSQIELNKLVERNASISGHLQHVKGQIDVIPRPDIRTAYNAAMDAQQRLMVMRGQIEKLQCEKNGIETFIKFLDKTNQNFYRDAEGGGRKSSQSGTDVLEMVISSQEAVRQRLSRQMHDGPAQALSNFIVQAEIAGRLFEIDADKARDELANLKAAAMSTFQKVRVFIFELRPMMLDDLGLFPTIRRYVDNFKEEISHDVTLSIKGQERRLEAYLEVMIFRALQELLGNASRHNNEKSEIDVKILIEDSWIRVSVSDTGKGFDPLKLEKSEGLGLKLIKERVELLGGNMDIESAVGQGTKITFKVPSLEVKQ
ncbi:MAG: ATP-binding protein [Anaerolineaceae bacterium]|nr:ATP-binding protein [Anaerolineaceae bacterium]